MPSTMRWTAWTGGLLASATVMHACVVGTSGDCAENGTCRRSDAGADARAATDAGAGGARSPSDDAPFDPASGDAVADAAIAASTDGALACNPADDPKDAPCLVRESYGVFVAPPTSGGDDTSGDGSRANPYATIGKALRSLGTTTRVYVCDATYAEQITLTVVASIFGGFACPGWDAGAAWKYIGGAAHVNSPSADYAIRIDAVKDHIAIEDIAFAAPAAHAQDSAGNGRSSIAALVNATAVDWKRVSLTAGSGADALGGIDGTAMPNYGMVANAPSGAPGTASGDGGDGGGAGGANACANGSASNGGFGGSAGSSVSTPGGDGRPGTSNPVLAATPGQDGSGGKGGAATCGAAPSPGAIGAAGPSGIAASSYGSLSPSGWVPSTGADAAAGQPGQGGGGGGGLGTLGGSGGGAGGCGGAGSTGGKGGGGSIALASFGSTQRLVQCTLITSFGGNGGAGGNGENGQGGGGSANAMFGCPGAPGGNGAGGSGGGGGSGGISVGILSTGASPVYDGLTAITVGAAGARGKHGTKGQGGSTPIGLPGNTGNDGDDGRPGLFQKTLAL
jgi:hypothetical protein